MVAVKRGSARGAQGAQGGGCVVRTTRAEPQPTPVAPRAAKRVGETQARWAWTEPAVWTPRMLAALEHGVKGGKWYSLMDKVYDPRMLAAAWRDVRANNGAPARL